MKHLWNNVKTSFKNYIFESPKSSTTENIISQGPNISQNTSSMNFPQSSSSSRNLPTSSSSSQQLVVRENTTTLEKPFFCGEQFFQHPARPRLEEARSMAYAMVPYSVNNSRTKEEIGSNSQQQLAILSGNNNTHSRIKTKKTGINQEILNTILDDPNSLSNLPLSPVKPNYVTNDAFMEACISAASFDLIKEGAAMSDVILLQNLFRGNIGNNITNMQCLGGQSTKFKLPVNFKSNFPEEFFTGLSEEHIEKIKNLDLRQNMLLAEIMAAQQLRSEHSLNMSVTNEQKFEGSWYANNSGNKKPDYLLALPGQVGPVTHTGYDLKCRDGNKVNTDIVQGCSDNIGQKTLAAQKNLKNLLEQEMINKKFSGQDKIIAENFIADLNQNAVNFANTKNTTSFVSGYNGLRITYNDLLVRNAIGMHLMTDLSINRVIVSPEIKDAFAQKFKYYYTSEDSPLLNYLNNAHKNSKEFNLRNVMVDYSYEVFQNY